MGMRGACTSNFAIPASAGIHLQVYPFTQGQEMDPRIRGDDEVCCLVAAR